MGIVLALASALLLGLADVATRALVLRERRAGRPAPSRRALAALRFGALSALLLCIAPALGAPPRESGFWWVVAIGAPLEVAALLLYMRAVGAGVGPTRSGQTGCERVEGELSLSLPLLACTPAFVLVTGPLVAGDPWRARAVPGVVLVSAGLWWLYRTDRGSEGLFAPFRALAARPASRAMLVVASIYAITSALGKRGVGLVGPQAMALWYFLAVSIALWPLFATRLGEALGLCRRYPLLAAVIVSSYAAHLFAHMAALDRLPAADMIALKRTSVLFASVAAWRWLGEPRARLPAAALMVAGAAAIALAGR